MVTLLIIIASIYLLGRLLRWLLPIYILHKAKKFNGQGFGSQFSQQQQYNQQKQSNKSAKKEGSVTVEVNDAPTNQKIDKKLGDYVDYVDYVEEEETNN